MTTTERSTKTMDFDIEPPLFKTRVIPGSPPDELPMELNPRSLREHGVLRRVGIAAAARTPGTMPVTTTTSSSSPRSTSQAANSASLARTLSFCEDTADLPRSSMEASTHSRLSVEALETCLRDSYDQQKRQAHEFQSERKQWQDAVASLEASVQQQSALSSQRESTMKMELKEHYELELYRLREENQAALDEATRDVVRQTERNRRFAKAMKARLESLQAQLTESQNHGRELQSALSSERAKVERLTQEILDEKQHGERIVLDRDRVIIDLETKLAQLQTQVAETIQLRSEMKHQEEQFTILEDELLEALNHIEVLEEFKSTEDRERDEVILKLKATNETLRSQLEEAIQLGEESESKLSKTTSKLSGLERHKEVASRLAVVAKSLLQSRLSRGADELENQLPENLESMVKLVERIEGAHAQMMLDEALDDAGSFTSTETSQIVTAPPPARNRNPGRQLASSIPTPSKKFKSRPESVTHVKPQRDLPVGVSTPVQATDENDRNARTATSRPSRIDGPKGTSQKLPSAHTSKIARPQTGKPRSHLQKYGPRSVLQDQPPAAPSARSGFSSKITPSVSSLRGTRVASKGPPKHDAYFSTRSDSEVEQKRGAWKSSAAQSSIASGGRSDASTDATEATASAMALEWSNVGRSGDELLDSVRSTYRAKSGQSRPTLRAVPSEYKGLSYVTSPATQSKTSKTSPRILMVNVARALTPPSPCSNTLDHSTDEEAHLPAESIDGTPLESSVGSKFGALYAEWSNTKQPSALSSPTSLLPSSLQFSTVKKAKRNGCGSSSAVTEVHGISSSGAASFPTSKRLKVDEARLNCATGTSNATERVNADIFAMIESEMAASATPYESLLSPYPAKAAVTSTHFSFDEPKPKAHSNVNCQLAAIEKEEHNKFPGGVQNQALQGPATHSSPAGGDSMSSALAARTDREFLSASMIQSRWRCSFYRRKYLVTINAVVILQSVSRMNIVRNQRKQLKRAVVVVQRFLRRTLNAECQRRSSLVRLQSAWRCISARRSYKKHVRMLSLVQARFRGARTRRQLRKMREHEYLSCASIQAAWKCHKERRKYQVTRKSILVAQRYVRRIVAKARYRQAKDLRAKWTIAASRIQNVCRTYRSQRSYVNTIRMIVLLQTFFRCFIARQRRLRMVTRQVEACTTIQASWRRVVDRRDYEESRKQIVRLQSFARSYLASRSFNRLRGSLVPAVLSIQRSWRSSSARRIYIHKLCTILILQSFFRGCSTRKQIKIWVTLQVAACTKLQAAWRRYVACLDYTKSKRSAMLIQQFLRAGVTIRKLSRLESQVQAAIKIQQSWRRNNAEKRLQLIRRFAIVVQARFRGFAARHRLAMSKIACLRIQSTWKRYLHVRSYAAKMKVIVHIQAVVRGYLAKSTFKRIQRIEASKIIAVSSIQRAWRRTCARSKSRVALSKVLLIQAVYRGHVSRRSTKTLRERLASTRIQASWKCFKSRKSYIQALNSISQLQAFARCSLAKSRRRLLASEKAHTVVATLVVQTHWRGVLARVTYLNTRNKIVLLQSLVRGYFSRRRTQSYRDIIVKAVTCIQRMWMGRCTRTEYVRLVRAVLRVQSLVRGVAARATAKKRRLVVSAVSLQRAWRRSAALKAYKETLSSVRLLQECYRSIIVRRRLDRLLLDRLEDGACTTIQAHWRRHCQHHAYGTTKRAVVLLQQIIRSRQAMSRLRDLQSANRVQLCSATTIQTAWRAGHVRQHYKCVRSAATWLQARWRGVSQRTSYGLMKSAAVTIEAWTRRCLVNRRLIIQRLSAEKLQAMVRGFVQRSRFNMTMLSVVRMQSFARMILAQAVASSLRCHVHAAVKIQALSRRFLRRQLFLTMLQAAIVIQKSVRGYQTCRRLSTMDFERIKSLELDGSTHREARYEAPPERSRPSRRSARVTGDEVGVQVAIRKPLGSIDETVKVSNVSQVQVKRTSSPEASKTQIVVSSVNVPTTRECAEKLKVQELRDILRNRGVANKVYRNLRKADLVAMVLDAH